MLRFCFAFILLCCNTLAFGKLYEDYDPFAGSLHQETDVKGFVGGNILNGTLYLAIVPVKTTLFDESELYQIKLKWSGRPVNLAEEAQKIVLLIDDIETEINEKLDVSGMSLNKTITNDGFIPEITLFKTTPELLRQLATASKVQCAVYLKRGRISGTFNKRNQNVFKEFVEKVIGTP